MKKIPFLVILPLLCAVLFGQERGLAESVDMKHIQKVTLDVLVKDFLMSEVLSIIEESPNRSTSRTYLQSRSDRFKFIGTAQQEPVVLDGYSVLDLTSPIIGYSLWYYGSNGRLVIADATVNPLLEETMKKASKLVSSSLDSVSNPDGSIMYCLGISDLDASRIIKIMVRKMGPDYAIRYAVSFR